MVRGLYTSGWSMLVDQKRMDTISNNLANADTNGYKKDTVVLQSFPELLTQRIHDTRSALNPSGTVGSMELGRDVGEVFTYYTPGQPIQTNRSLDAAIHDSSNAFFTIQATDSQGNTSEYYTRDGSFKLNQSGQLVTTEGNAVMGEKGPVMLAGDDFSIDRDGNVVQNGEVIDRLKIKEFTDMKLLKKFGSNYVTNSDAQNEKEFTGTVAQGYLEKSNVNTVREMVDMITVMRSYEANQKMIQAQDGTLDKAVNEIGRTA